MSELVRNECIMSSLEFILEDFQLFLLYSLRSLFLCSCASSDSLLVLHDDLLCCIRIPRLRQENVGFNTDSWKIDHKKVLSEEGTVWLIIRNLITISKLYYGLVRLKCICKDEEKSDEFVGTWFGDSVPQCNAKKPTLLTQARIQT